MLRASLTAVFLVLPSYLSAETQVHRDATSGQRAWSIEMNGFGLQLIQLNPDYVTAFYAGRGLARELVEEMSKQCVFGTIARNLADQPLTYRVADWHYSTPDGQNHSLTTKSDWVKRWKNLGSAFKWSLLPDEQTFAVGDWSQGFTTVDLAPGARFDFHFSWRVGERVYEHTFEGVECGTQP